MKTINGWPVIEKPEDVDQFYKEQKLSRIGWGSEGPSSYPALAEILFDGRGNPYVHYYTKSILNDMLEALKG